MAQETPPLPVGLLNCASVVSDSQGTHMLPEVDLKLRAAVGMLRYIPWTNSPHPSQIAFGFFWWGGRQAGRMDGWTDGRTGVCVHLYVWVLYVHIRLCACCRTHVKIRGQHHLSGLASFLLAVCTDWLVQELVGTLLSPPLISSLQPPYFRCMLLCPALPGP